MANRYLIAAGGDWLDGTSNIWAAASGGAADGGGIAIGDTAILDANSGALALKKGSVCAAFDTTGYTSTATWADVPLYYPQLGAVTHAAGTLAMGTCDPDWTSSSMTGGILAGSGAMNIAGNISVTGGTMSHTGKWTQTASANVANNSFGRRFTHLSLGGAGVTSTLTDNVYAQEFTHGAGAVTGARIISIYAAANDFWHAGTGTIDISQIIVDIVSTARTMGAMLVTSLSSGLTLTGTTGRKLTQTGPINIGTSKLNIYPSNAGTAELDLAGSALTVGQIQIGTAAASNFSGILSLGEGIIRIGAGGLARGNAANLANALNFDSAYVENAAAIDCTGMAVTNVACHIMGGTVSNVNNGSAEPIHCHGTIDGGGNTGVDFDKHAAPGHNPLVLVGVGA